MSKKKEEPEEEEGKDTARWVFNFMNYYEKKYKVPEEKSVLRRLLSDD